MLGPYHDYIVGFAGGVIVAFTVIILCGWQRVERRRKPRDETGNVFERLVDWFKGGKD